MFTIIYIICIIDSEIDRILLTNGIETLNDDEGLEIEILAEISARQN